MTPGARVQAAIEILDDILSGTQAERALTRWARASRYAGSKDRAAVRDHVFDALRQRDSAAWVGGGSTGRGIMIGVLSMGGADLDALFSGVGHAPAQVSAAEMSTGKALADAPEAVQADLPAWMVPYFERALGTNWMRLAAALRMRAPLDLRVNTQKSDRQAAQDQLARDGITATPLDGVATALRVTEGARQVARSKAYLGGVVELQDASSQAAVLACDLAPGARVLDFCAGGGGKALALAACSGAPVHVHDIDPDRMRDVPARARRAGADCPVWDGRGTFDLVFADAPCSGSGTWRRAPDAKWRLTPGRLVDLMEAQAEVLRDAAPHVAPKGRLAYATCSVFAEENGAQIAAFREASPEWGLVSEKVFGPKTAGDGFYLAILERHVEAQQL